MANDNLPQSFEVVNPEQFTPKRFLVDASYTGKKGDMVFVESAGYGSDANTNPMAGIQASGILSVNSSVVESTGGTAGTSYIMVYDDRNIIIRGQITTGAQTDRYTTATSTAGFDIAGTAGVQYIDAGQHSKDQVRILGPAIEKGTGKASAYGAYQKVLFQMSNASHYTSQV